MPLVIMPVHHITKHKTSLARQTLLTVLYSIYTISLESYNFMTSHGFGAKEHLVIFE